jgi:hypothetical protein
VEPQKKIIDRKIAKIWSPSKKLKKLRKKLQKLKKKLLKHQ